MRKHLFPMVYAANKADIAPKGVLEAFPNHTMMACMADMELALRRANEAGLIHYRSGDASFSVQSPESLNDAQKKALDHMQERLATFDGTGMARLMDDVLFDRLNHIVVYPVQDETHWVDGDGRVLPDAFVVPSGIQAKALAVAFIPILVKGSFGVSMVVPAELLVLTTNWSMVTCSRFTQNPEG